MNLAVYLATILSARRRRRARLRVYNTSRLAEPVPMANKPALMAREPVLDMANKPVFDMANKPVPMAGKPVLMANMPVVDTANKPVLDMANKPVPMCDVSTSPMRPAATTRDVGVSTSPADKTLLHGANRFKPLPELREPGEQLDAQGDAGGIGGLARPPRTA